ncbi:MAG: hypothetical protein OXI40_03385 [Chloroflexota bacterium]|nr:hypothetical protein [Chloroflexota bacterium]
MKLSKLDIVVFGIVALCLLGVALAAILSDPARQPIRVAYLYPATSSPQNVWMAEIGNPDAQEQVTFSENGVYDFDFSPDGDWLAFSERSEKGIVNLRLMDMRSGRVTDLADCESQFAYCTTPVFSPDGGKLAYQRSESLNGSYGLSRIWLMDMASGNYETDRLIADSRVVGHSPVWAANGNTIAFYSADVREPGILIFDFIPRDGSDAQLRFIPSSHGAMGTISPNGQRIIFPEITRRGEQFFTYLRIADLGDKTFAAFTDPNGPADEASARWNPDGQTVALARRYTDKRWTPGHQLYLRSANDEDEALAPVLYDERYSTSYFRWNQTGDRLVMQRLPLASGDGVDKRRRVPEIWVYDIESGDSSKVAENAFVPQWIGF